MQYSYFLFLLSALLLVGSCAQHTNTDHIQPYQKNPWYWQYKGEPVMLIGGS